MKKNGQVWIETVLYTLIGLALIGLALGFIMPQINAAKDKSTVEQAISSLADFDERVNTVIETGVGNIRQIEFYMKKGELEINSESYAISGESEIKLTLSDLSKPYSEVGVPVNMGRIKVLTEESQKAYSVSLTISYKTEIKYNGLKNKKFTSASTPYKFSIENKGSFIDILEISGQA